MSSLSTGSPWCLFVFLNAGKFVVSDHYMQKFSLVLTLVLMFYGGVGISLAQSSTPIEDKFNDLVERWVDISDIVGNYDGLKKYCSNRGYHKEVIVTLQKFHHVDSIILDKIMHTASGKSEVKKAEKEVKKFESKYSVKSFIQHLHEECKERHEVERGKRESKHQFGEESYDAQRLVVETELERYTSHINKRIEHIRNYIHEIPIDALN